MWHLQNFFSTLRLTAQLLGLGQQVMDLRQRFDQSEEERRKTQTQLTALLTDQRQKEASPPPKGFWQRLWNAKLSL